MKKRLLLTSILLAASVTVCACSKASDDSDTKKDTGSNIEAVNLTKDTDNKKSYESLSKLYEDLQNNVEFEATMEAPEEYVENAFGITSEDYEDGCIYIADSELSACTIAILKTTDKDKMENLVELLKEYKSSKEDELEDYLPEQYDLVKNSKVVTKGEYVYLVISEQSSDIIKFIEAAL